MPSDSANRILLIEDNPADARIFQLLLKHNRAFDIEWVESLSAAKQRLECGQFDVCVLDLNLPDGSGIPMVEALISRVRMPPIVVLSGISQHDLDVARGAVSAGAQDYLSKDRLDEDALRRALTMAIERHRLNQMLAQREAELEEAQKLAQVGDWRYPAGGRSIQTSVEICRQLGIPASAANASPYAIFRRLSADSRRRLLESLRKVCFSGEVSEIRLELNQSSGVELVVRVELRARFTEDGTLIELYGISQDVTALLVAERAKNEFISVVSHELRTPLTSILGSLKLVLGTNRAEVSAMNQNLLGIALQNGERLLSLINDLLDLEKIESGRMEFAFERTDLITVMAHAIDQNEPYARQFGVRLQLENDQEYVPINLDPKRIAQLLGNLISNAVKFSDEGSAVVVKTELGDGLVRICVMDHGIGIPFEAQDQIFGRFVQVDSSDRRRHQGTGLGLSIVKLIAEGHGGVCHFQSEPGKGTAFYVELPRLPPATKMREQIYA